MALLDDRCIRCAKCFVLAVLALGHVSIASAQLSVTTEWGHIQSFMTRSDDAMAVYHSAPFKNSAVPTGIDANLRHIFQKCKLEDGGYATDPSDPGHKLHHAAIIGAYLHHKQVRFGLSECVLDKPRIVFVDVKD